MESNFRDYTGNSPLFLKKFLQFCNKAFCINSFFPFQKSGACEKDICTAPVFRARPELDGGFLHGGFWKYNTKPSNIIPCSGETENDESEGTIQDDVTVAGQDVAAGLIRMGILPRICYLLEVILLIIFIISLTFLVNCLLAVSTFQFTYNLMYQDA